MKSISLALLIAACSSRSPVSTDATVSVDAGDTPVILSLTSTVSEITANGSFTVVAVVTEPTGLANLVGGKLTNGDGTVTYGAFIATTQGTYSLTISWNQLDAIAPIAFDGATMMTFRATFYNAAGHSVSQDLAIRLYCGSGAAPDAACSGQCVQLDTTTRCGSCGAGCATSTSDLSVSSVTCAAPGSCQLQGELRTLDATHFPNDSCDSTCAAAAPGGQCATATATLLDGSTQAISCGDSVTSYQPTSTVSATAYLYCRCGTSYQLKTKAGSCDSLCTTATCTSTVFAGSTGQVADACSAPYLYAAWDSLISSQQITVALENRPYSIACTCGFPAH
jgi:hypothetical protein